MSKTLVQKALLLMQDDIIPDKSEKKTKPSSKKSKKTQQNPSLMMKTSSGIGKKYAAVDRTAENLKILKQLRHLKPKASVAEKVVKYYTMKDAFEKPAEQLEIQRSILFDDDEDDKKKRKKRKRNVDDSH